MIFTKDTIVFIKNDKLDSAATSTKKMLARRVRDLQKGNNNKLASAVIGKRKFKKNINCKWR